MEAKPYSNHVIELQIKDLEWHSVKHICKDICRFCLATSALGRPLDEIEMTKWIATPYRISHTVALPKAASNHGLVNK